jgi:penicillin-binding protein 1A
MWVKLFFLALRLGVFGAVIGAIVTALLFTYYAQDLPSYSELAKYNPPSVTRIYSADGKLMEEYAKENRVFIPIENVPTSLIQAFIAAEDKNFYQHQGLDFVGLVRAICNNVINIAKNKRMEGASTIPQQVVKIFLLGPERSLPRKIKEAILSFKISQVYSKEKILELYLNETFLGYGAYGVASAAKKYFNKSLEELDLAQSALLAALPKFPSILNSKNNYEKARGRRDYVLQRMVEDGYISQEAANAAFKTPITIAKPAREDRFEAGYYAEHVRNKVISMFGQEEFYGGGLTIITPLNSAYQKATTSAFIQGIRAYDEKYGFKGPLGNIALDNWPIALQKYSSAPRLLEYEVAVVLDVLKDKVQIGLVNSSKDYIALNEMKWARSNLKSPKDILKQGDVIAVSKLEQKYALRQIPSVDGATIVMDSATGKVLAMVSGYDYASSKFDRATQAQRQPGSLIKPFVYLAALERGIEPTVIFEDKPIEIYQGPGLPIYRPKNFKNDYLGSITMRAGLELSRNVVTLQVAKMIGIGSVAEIISRYGINENPPKFYSMTLGSLETTLDKITAAYGAIANRCNAVQPVFIEMIKDRNGKVIYKRDQRRCQGCSVINPDASPMPQIIDVSTKEPLSDSASCYQITSMLQGAVERGTARSAKKLEKVLAGKTGTSNDSKDAWFVGFTPQLVVGTYVGFDQPKGMGRTATGATVALPIFINLFQTAPLKNLPSLDFRVGDNITIITTNAKTGARVESGGIAEAVKTQGSAAQIPDTQSPFERLSPQEDALEGIDIY